MEHREAPTTPETRKKMPTALTAKTTTKKMTKLKTILSEKC
jgi:hypothetical protein